MSYRNHRASDPAFAARHRATSSQEESQPLWDIADVLRILWMRWYWPVGLAILGAVAALVYALAVPKEYAAKTTLVIDPRGLQVVERELTPRSQNSTVSLAVVESQISVITSAAVLRPVVIEKNLVNDTEFGARPPSLIGRVKGWLRALVSDESARPDPELAALTALRRAVRAERVTNSYVIDLYVKSRDREKAARLANAIAKTYITLARTEDTDMNARTSAALTGQLQTLKARVQEAEAAVEAFKAKHDILSARGGLVNEQQIAELTNQLVTARVQASQAQARYDQIFAVLRVGGSTEALGESTQSATIGQLRVRLAAARQAEAGLLVSLRPAHPAVRSARASVNTIERQIRDELRRIAQTAKGDLERARSSERELRANLEALKVEAEKTNAASVQLRELERAAKANRSVYEAFLVRTKELAGQKDVDTSNARIVTPASPPHTAIGPGTALLVTAGSFLGLGLGTVIALLAAQLDAKSATAQREHRPPPRDPDHTEAPEQPAARMAAVGRLSREALRPRRRMPGTTEIRPANISDDPPLAMRMGAGISSRSGDQSSDIGKPMMQASVSRLSYLRPVGNIDGNTAQDTATDHGQWTDVSRVSPERAGRGAELALVANADNDTVVTPFPSRQKDQPISRARPQSRHASPSSTAPPVSGTGIEIIAEVDRAELRGRAVAATVLDTPDAAAARPYRLIMGHCRRQRGVRRSVAVLVVAPERHRGSAHVALNLASAAVLQGERVLLVDADLRGRKLSRTLCPGARAGLVEYVRGEIQLDSVLWHDPETFDVVPLARGVSGRVATSAIEPATLKSSFARLGRDYGVVVVDGGTLGAGSPAARIVAAADRVILVVLASRAKGEISISLPDQIKLQTSKILGAIALIEQDA